MKYQVYMTRNRIAPAVKLGSFDDRDSADRLAAIYIRDYPQAAIEVKESEIAN
jgi:hypothetical protein